MNIGQAADRSGVPPKTIRYYEDIGLIQAADRAPNGYRDYGAHDVETLRFLKRARSLGFSVEKCRELLSLYRDRSRASVDVKRIAEARVREIDAKIAELQAMRRTLTHLMEKCHGDERPDCPILDDLAGDTQRTPSVD